MTQQAVSEFAEAPLISPPDSEEESWDAVEYDDAPVDESTGEEPEPGADEAESPDDDGGESGDESPDQHPASEDEMRQQRAQWAAHVALDPNFIAQVPRRQRKAILTAAEIIKPAAVNIAGPLSERMAEARFWQMIQLQDKVAELDVLAEDDPQGFQAALSNPQAHGFTDETIDQWRRVRQWRENGGPAGTPPQNGQAQPPEQQRPQQQFDPGVARWQTRATALLDEYGEEFGESAVGIVIAWLQEEGLVNVRTAQEAESGYKALRAHLDGLRSQSRGGPPPAVQRRRALPKPDVSPGSVAVGGRASRDEMHRKAFGGSESDAWDF